MTSQEAVFAAVSLERLRQDTKWGTNFKGRADEKWLTILTEEVGEVAEAMLRDNDHDIEAELIQVAAVCVSWMEYRTPRSEQPRLD